MARRIRLSERDLTRLIQRVINEDNHNLPDPRIAAYVEPDYEGYYVGDDEETEVYHLDEPEFLKAVKYWCDQGGPEETEGTNCNTWIESANLLSQAEAYCNTL